MESNMTFLCDMWRISAEEYMTFLMRYGINCFGIYIISRDRTVIFADETKYLELALNDRKFIEAEKQIVKLLERSEKLVVKFTEFVIKTQTSKETLDDDLEQELEEGIQQYDEE